MSNENYYVLKLGGSIIVPELPDTDYLMKFRTLIREQVELGKKFIIIPGGGRTSRNYRDAVQAFSDLPTIEAHRIGFYTNWYNSHLIRIIFKEDAYGEVVQGAHNMPNLDEINESVIIGGPSEPGNSSNEDAVRYAEAIGAKTIINLSNIDHVYSEDPRKNPDAEMFTDITWEHYRTLIPEVHEPSASAPFDPNASKKAHELGMDVIFMKGNPIDTLVDYFQNGTIDGTLIHA